MAIDGDRYYAYCRKVVKRHKRGLCGRLLRAERGSLARMEGRAKGPSAPPEKVARVGGPEAQGVGEERQERPGDTRVERDRQVARLGLLQAIPVRAHGDVARQHFERQCGVEEQQKVPDRPRKRPRGLEVHARWRDLVRLVQRSEEHTSEL